MPDLEVPVVCACAGAEGRGFGLKKPDKGSEELQLHQYPSAHLPREWTRPGKRQYADVLAATAHIVVSQGQFWPFLAQSRPELSDTVGGWRQTERCQRVKNTLVWTPIGWIETSEALVVRPYRASDPNTRPERPQLCVPAQGLRVEVLA